MGNGQGNPTQAHGLHLWAHELPCSSIPDLKHFIFFSFVTLVLQVFLEFWLYSTPTEWMQ